MTGEATAAWEGHRVADRVQLAALSREAQEQDLTKDILADPEFVAAQNDWPRQPLIVLTARRTNQLVGMATLRGEGVRLPIAIGPWVILRPKLLRFYLHEGPALGAEAGGVNLAGFAQRLDGQLPTGSVVFCFALATGSALHQALRDPKSELQRRFFLLPWGEPTLTCSIAWSGSVDAYLKTISSSSRHDLRRRRKRFLEDATLLKEVRPFVSLDDVDMFLRDASLLSAKTWQGIEGVGGVACGGMTERVIRFAAARNAFLGFIVYINGEPAAYQYGFIYRGAYTVEQIGYDPAWTQRHHLGSVLFFESLHFIEHDHRPIRTIDFSANTTTFKLRTTNSQRAVVNCYLIQRSLRGVLLFGALRLAAWLSAVGKRLLRGVSLTVSQE